MSNKQYLKQAENRYYYLDSQISRNQYQRIAYGNWADLPSTIILKKLAAKQKRGNDKKNYVMIYEEILSRPLGQYCLGIALEKVSNDIIRLCKRNIAEGRRLVRTNKGKV
jgi:hypothetical protein